MNCRVCDSPRLALALDLGRQPWCDDLLRPEQAGREPYYALRLLHCQSCHAAQIDATPSAVPFGDRRPVRKPSAGPALELRFGSVADDVDRRFMADRLHKSVLDVGSQDGAQLVHYRARGYDVLGVESSKAVSQLANARGLDTLHADFSLDLATQLDRRFDVVSAADVLSQVPRLHSVAEGIRASLKDDGLLVVQCPYMKRIVEDLAFDRIFHDHRVYWTLTTLGSLLKGHGLEIFDAYQPVPDPGSLVVFAGHPGKHRPSVRLREQLAQEAASGCNGLAWYRAFATRVEQRRDRDLAFLEQQRGSGRRVFGFGAPIHGNTLLNYFGVGPELLPYLVERDRERRGLVSPGTHIPVVLESDIDRPPDVYYVLARDSQVEILDTNRHLIGAGVSFYFPVGPNNS